MRIIGNDPSVPRQTQEVASGTLPNGKPVVVNSDGTVSTISLSSATEDLGDAVQVQTSTQGNTKIGYDSNSDKFVVIYADGSNYGKAKVGTISGDSVSYGSEATFNSGSTSTMAVAFDSTNNKIVISFRDQSNSYYGTAIVGTISGTSITFGTEVVYESVNTSAQQNGLAYDSSNQRIVVGYRDNTNNKGRAVVGTVSGTSISFGTPVNLRNGVTNSPAVSYNSAQNKVLFCYGAATSSAEGRVGTVSGTSISFGTAATFLSSQASYIDLAYDSSSDKHILIYSDTDDSYNGKVRTATISGTDVSFGTAIDFSTGTTSDMGVAFDETAKKFVIDYIDVAQSSKSFYRTGSISGTNVTVSSEASLDSSNSGSSPEVAVNGSGKALLAYIKGGTSGRIDSKVLQIGYSNTNLTSENYIGMSSGPAFQTGSADSVGSETEFINQMGNEISAATL